VDGRQFVVCTGNVVEDMFNLAHENTRSIPKDRVKLETGDRLRIEFACDMTGAYANQSLVGLDGDMLCTASRRIPAALCAT